MGNAAFDWDAFDSDAYLAHYYQEPHPDDAALADATARALAAAAPEDRPLDVVDVGTGPNLFPLLCALPRARTLTAWEYSQANVEWLETERRRPALRPLWRHYWGIVRAAAGRDDLPDDPRAAIAAKMAVRQASIFDLPARRWDAGTMFFCAESITRDEEEFGAACAAFARCVRPGGTLVAAFLDGSRGYDFGGRAWPALPMTPERIAQAFTGRAEVTAITGIGGTSGQSHGGYSGALLLTARAA